MMKPSLLVVEDSRTQAAAIQILLEEAGYQVLLAADGRQGLEMIRSHQPDLVVTDLEMPVMNGLELVEAAKAEFPQLPVVLITARGSERIAAEALSKGAASYVPKRYLDDLIPTLHRLWAVLKADRASVQLLQFLTFVETEYRLGNDLQLVAPLVARLQESVLQFGICDPMTAIQTAMALEESLQNAIFHGNLEVPSKLREEDKSHEYRELAEQRRQIAPFKDRRVFVRFRATRDEARFVIRDEGPGFNPASIPDPTSPENLDKPCGRGLLLINSFMDEVHHNDRGNEIFMVKRRRNGSLKKG
jgi:CheY-like chemotaxis protein